MPDLKQNQYDIDDRDGKKIQLSEYSSDNYDQNSTFKRFNTSFHHFRYVIIFMGGLAMGTMLFLRLTITVAMISMVNHTAIYLREHPNATQDDLAEFFFDDYVEVGEFYWTNEIQQAIISGYMVAYTLPQFFTTRLTMRYGLRLGIGLSLAACSISVLLTPIMSHWGWQFTLALRFLNGVGGSAILPSMVNAIETWLPSNESTKGVVLFQFMSYSILTLTPLISGFLTSFHWKWAFYVPGALGLAITLMWWILAANEPNSSKFLSQKELDHINDVAPLTDVDKNGSEKPGKTTTRVAKVKQRHDLPWYFVFKIKQFYALTLLWALFCSTVGGFLFLLPAYLKRVLKIPVGEIGMMNFYVQIGVMFCMLWPHPVVSFLQKKFGVSLSFARSVVVFSCKFSNVNAYLISQSRTPMTLTNFFLNMKKQATFLYVSLSLIWPSTMIIWS